MGKRRDSGLTGIDVDHFDWEQNLLTAGGTPPVAADDVVAGHDLLATRASHEHLHSVLRNKG
jgi:hypothetical protein